MIESTDLDDRGEPMLRVWRRPSDGMFRFLYGDGSDFVLDGCGRRLWVQWLEPNTLEDVSSYLLGPILGFVLRLHGAISLHASAVVIDGQAIALAGPAGAGKSTTAAAFAQRGHAVLSDDLAVLEPHGGEYLVQVDCPILRLWPESSEMLFGSADALPRLSGTWDKRYLDLAGHGSQAARVPCPLAAIYLLDCGSIAEAGPAIRTVRGRDGLLALVAHSYAAPLLDAEMRATEFELFAELVGKLPVLGLHRPEEGVGPAELCDLIIDDFSRRRSAA
ncbi:MAG: serine/threonine protein kinase [bacterium]|nr:serine/threonine protein kinase [bacterium]